MESKKLPITPPSFSDLASISSSMDLKATESELKEYEKIIPGLLESYKFVDSFSITPSFTSIPRSPGYKPSASENRYNAWYYKCDIKSNEHTGGLLEGKTLALKDNIFLAGIPLMNGSRVLEGFIPDEDATVVIRILKAGGRILGKAHCEDLCLSGGSHTNSTGCVKNPLQPEYSAGGSSSGSAVLVACGEVDMALGGDQGGSIRIPSSMCGVVGLKPTYGLVPYTGIIPIEMTLDHVGPIAKTVDDCAKLLQVIAGKDGIDHRFYTYFDRRREEISYDYLKKAETWKESISKIKIGVLKEGFNGIDEEVVSIVNKAIEKLCSSFKIMKKEVSFPGHKDVLTAFGIILLEGTYDCLYEGNMSSTNHITWGSPQLMNHAKMGFKANSKELSHTNKLYMMLGKYVKENYGNKYYAKASKMRNFFIEGYCNLLKEEVDLLIMPTLPKTAQSLPTVSGKVDIQEYIKVAFGDICNTAAFDLTGMPALTINVAEKGKLPVGLMIVGDYFQEGVILQLAKAVESLKLN